MTTLIDTPEGRCDARCHFAREWVCTCVCAGRYHGRGIDGSLDRTIEETPDAQLDAWEAIGGVDVSGVRTLRMLAPADRRARLATSARRRSRRIRRSTETGSLDLPFVPDPKLVLVLGETCRNPFGRAGCLCIRFLVAGRLPMGVMPPLHDGCTCSTRAA